MPAWWTRHAWLGGDRTASDVLLQVKGGRFAAVTPNVTQPPGGAIRLEGLTLPGLANVHSHAFHRALRGRTQEAHGSFWTWRDLMYAVADRLDPDGYLRLARAVYAEMALAGFTAVGEFHYLHHGPGGVPYADRNVMGQALIEAARLSGVRLTLLDACYLEGGFDAPLRGAQRRFGDGTSAGWIDRVQCLRGDSRTRIGAAIHSVRAVPPLAMAEVAGWAGSRGWRLHAHVSEQRKEQTDCLRHRGTTPLGVLAAAGAVHPGFTAVHGTHFADTDIVGLARRGRLLPVPDHRTGPRRRRRTGCGAAGRRRGAQPRHRLPRCHRRLRGSARGRTGRPPGQPGTGPAAAVALLEAATENGMTALGWDAGALAPGRLADFITIRLDSPRTAGADPSLVATAVFAAAASDVDVVVVDGQQVVSGGNHLLVPDVGRELTAAIPALHP